VIDLKPVTVLRGVGEALATRLRGLGVETTQDLLFLLPLRYEDRTRIVPLGELRWGQRASVEGEVLLTEVAFRGRRQMLCRIADGSGFLTLRFFYFTAQQQQGLARGARVRCLARRARDLRVWSSCIRNTGAWIQTPRNSRRNISHPSIP
jgi:ATP-dependent DNA helicase RecG